MFKLFKNLKKRDYIFAFIAGIFIIVQVWLELKMPDYMSEITILVQTEGSKMSEILKNGGYMILCAFGSFLSAVVVGYLVANVSASFSLHTRKKLFNKIEKLSIDDIKSFNTSSLITRTTNDITQIMMFLAFGMQMLIKSPVTAVWAITKISNKSFEWSLITAVAVVILLSMVIITMLMVVPKFKKLQKLTDRVNGITREQLNGIRVVRAFNAEKFQEEKFSSVNDDLTGTQLFVQKRFALFSPIMYLVMYFLTLSIYFIGAKIIEGAMLSEKIKIFGDMIVFSSYAMQIIMSFLMLAMIFMILPRAKVSASRINDVLDTDIKIKKGNITKLKEEGTVEFKNVSFKYPDAEEYILRDISFTAKKGETVAFIGSTGSGKSTLVNLIPRFYDATKGEVLVDGINVKEYDFKTLNNKLGYVPQKAVIFNGTIKENVSYGESKEIIDDKKIKEAIKVAEAKEFVEKMDDGYDSLIAASGTNISGGQKQRISIARAIARNPEIYIFDDTFSALDYKTDAKLRKNLKKYAKDSIFLIVAQRIGTIMNADKIVVLDKGKCVGIGTHKELLKSCEVYQEIALSQLSKGELENA